MQFIQLNRNQQYISETSEKQSTHSSDQIDQPKRSDKQLFSPHVIRIHLLFPHTHVHTLIGTVSYCTFRPRQARIEIVCSSNTRPKNFLRNF